MKDPNTLIFRLILVLATGMAASCGGGYGGGDGGGGGGGAASLTISIDPDTITLGDSATISWSTNGNGCTASGDWSGSKPGSGSEDVTPAEAGEFEYRLVCRGGGYGESREGSVTLTVNEPAQVTAWVGEGCCLEGRPFEVTGLTNSTGEHRFLALGRHYVGKPGAAREIFAACNDCLAGARLAGAGSFDLRKAAPNARATSLAELEGHYLAQVASGYMLTIGIDATGRMSGIDTRGCRLDGQVAAPARKTSVFAVTLEVSACGAGDGQYAGNAAPLPGVDGGLLLSASNRQAAIGWRLGR